MQLQDALIYGIKANGFLVFIPKYGIKGIVYIKVCSTYNHYHHFELLIKRNINGFNILFSAIKCQTLNLKLNLLCFSLQDKHGHMTIPQNALSVNPSEVVSDYAIKDFTYDKQNQRLILHTTATTTGMSRQQHHHNIYNNRTSK